MTKNIMLRTVNFYQGKLDYYYEILLDFELVHFSPNLNTFFFIENNKGQWTMFNIQNDVFQ